MLESADAILRVIHGAHAVQDAEGTLRKHLEAILLVLYAAQTDVIVYARVDTELLFLLIIDNDDFVLFLVGLGLELGGLGAE